jgi:negative regulator of replication initiation
MTLVSSRWRTATRLALCATTLVMPVGCGTDTPLDQLSEARRVSAELLIQFTKAADAANRAVMADTDQASIAFAKEAAASTTAVQTSVEKLRPLLQQLDYAEEGRLLQEFAGRFDEYRKLDRTILELAVENTNLKAQRLSFGEAQDAASAFTKSLESVTPSAAGEMWHVRALVAGAVAALRDIQVGQAPHIAAADDAVMTRIETRMKASEAAVRNALQSLRPLVSPSSQRALTDASTAFDRFLSVHSQVLQLSRRNTNVRSLMMSLNQKGKLTSACETALRALQEALMKRRPTASR